MKTRYYIFLIPLLFFSCDEKEKIEAIATRFEKQKTERIIPVKTLTVDTVSDIVTHVYSAVMEESLSTDLNFKYGGTLETIKVKEGSRVRKGDVIAKVSSTALTNSQRTAQATLSQAQDGYNRLKKVYESGSLPEVKWKEMQTDLEKAQAGADMADDMFKESIMEAPFSGIITARYVEAGTNVSPMQPVVRIISNDGIVAKISVPENEISNIQLDDNAIITIPALDNKVFQGKVAEKGMTASPISHSYFVKIKLNKDMQLLPGMIGKVTLKSDVNTGIVIPSNIVLLDENGKFIWVVKGGRAHKNPIEVSGYSGNGVIVSEGLQQGDSVVVEGYQKISESMRTTSYGKQDIK